jgi:hypothetical protein
MSWVQVQKVKVGSTIHYGGKEYEVKRNDFKDLSVQASDLPFPQSLKAIVEGRGDDFDGYNHEFFVTSQPQAVIPSVHASSTRAILEAKFAVRKQTIAEQLQDRFKSVPTCQGIPVTSTLKVSPSGLFPVPASKSDVDVLRQQLSSVAARANEAHYRIDSLEDDEDEDEDSYDEDQYDSYENSSSEEVDALRERVAKLEHGAIQSKLNSTQPQSNGGRFGMNLKGILGSFTGLFGKVSGQFALSPAGIAVRSNPNSPVSSWVAYDAKTGQLTDVQNMTFDLDVPAFRLPVDASAIAVGDIVVNDGKYQYVVEQNDDYVITICPSTRTRGSVLPVKNLLLQKSFYTVVKVIDFTNAGATATGGFNPLLLMAMDKGEGGKKDILPFLLMSGGLGGANGSTAGIDPMMLMMLGDNTDDLLPLLLLQQGGIAGGNAMQGILPLLLMGDKGGSGGGMKDILLMQALAGNGGGLGNLFGGAGQQTVAAPKATKAPEEE